MADEYAEYEDELAAFDEDEPGSDTGDQETGNAQDSAPSSPSRKSPARSGSKSPKSSNTMAEFPGRGGDDENEAKDDSGHSSPQSLGSGAMSESDEEDISPTAPPAGSSNGPLFPLEGRFYNEADKRRILSLTEAGREQILAERQEQIEETTFNQRLLDRRNEPGRSKATMGAPKRKTTDDHDLAKQPPRKVNRKRAEANEKLDNYKRQRNEREEKRQSLSTRSNLKASPLKETGLSGDSDSEDARGDFNDSPAPTQAALASKPEPEPSLKEMQRLHVGRSNFADFMFTPGFEGKVTGCYCRINLGPNPREKGTLDYRMAIIKDFVDGRPYRIEPSQGPPFNTQRYILAELGNQTKKFPFIHCSNEKYNEREFNRYKVEIGNEKKTLPRPSSIDKKVDGLHSIINHEWTEEEKTEKLRRSGAWKQNENSMLRDDYRSMRQKAADIGDAKEVARLDGLLQDLGESHVPVKVSAGGIHPKSGQFSGLSKPMNGINGKQNGNTDGTPQPEMSEFQRARLQRLEAASRKAEAEQAKEAQLAAQRKAREEREAIKRGDTPTKADPFARVKTNPKMHYDLKTVKPASGADKSSKDQESGTDDLFGDPSSTGGTREGTPAEVDKKKTNDSAGQTKNKMAAKLGIGLRKKNADFEVEDLGIEI